MGVKSTVEPGLIIPVSAFNEMRREVFAEILEQRKPVTLRAEGEFIPSGFASEELLPVFQDEPEHKPSIAPGITVSVTGIDQISEEMEELCPKLIYIPVTEFDYESPKLHRLIENEKITVAVSLPGVIHDNEKKRIAAMLDRARKLGVKNALVGNIGHIQFAKKYGMTIHGDIGFNVRNTETLYVLRKLGLKSATISFEMPLTEIREMLKPIETELVTYGRLPLMITENCIVRNCTNACTCDSFTGLIDENGALYPVLPEFGCRNVLLHSKKLFMADKRRTISSLGLWAERLIFTTENAIECATVIKRYMGKSDFKPQGYTRGLYYKNEDNMSL